MNKIKDFLEKNKFSIIISIFIIFVIGMPLFQDKLVVGDDYDYHISRIQSITESLENHIFPVKIHYSLANGYGYGSGLFYSNLFLYIPAIINLITNNLAFSYNIFAVLMLILMFFISYFSIKNITEEKYSALIGTSLIMLSKTLVLLLYHRFALGEFLGYMFIMPVISGMYDYVHKDFKKPYLLFIGFAGLVYTHLITTVICLCFAIIYFLIYIKSTIKNPKKFVKLIICAILVLLISSAYWAPMLEQMNYQTFKLSDQWTNIGEDPYYIVDLFGNGKYSIGILFTLILPFVCFGMFDKKVSKNIKVLGWIAILLLIIMVNSTFWKVTNQVTNIIQFKWRLLGVVTVLLSIVFACIMKEYSSAYKIGLKSILIAVVAFSTFTSIEFMYYNNQMNEVMTNDQLDEYMYKRPTSIGGGAEYLPIEIENINSLVTPFSAISSNDESIYFAKNNLRGEFDKTDNSTYYEVPFVYYFGYVANITLPSGEVEGLDVEKSENGLIKVIVPEDKIGHISVWYNGTKIQKVSYIASFRYIDFGYCIYIIKKNEKITI